MKKILILIFSIIALSVNAQVHTFKVTPKTFTDEVGVERTVTGIQARIVGGIDINLSDSTFSRTFYIAFELETGTAYGARNASTDEFVARAIANGTSEQTAIANVKNICRLLEYGTRQEKYTASAQLAGMYGYTLKPLNQQE